MSSNDLKWRRHKSNMHRHKKQKKAPAAIQPGLVMYYADFSQCLPVPVKIVADNRDENGLTVYEGSTHFRRKKDCWAHMLDRVDQLVRFHGDMVQRAKENLATQESYAAEQTILYMKLKKNLEGGDVAQLEPICEGRR